MSEGKVKVKILKSFMYNGIDLAPGDEVEMNFSRAVNHMRVGDVERDEELIATIKAERIARAEAAKKDAQGDW